MQNPLKGEQAFEVDGQAYRLVFAIDAMAALEDAFDLPMGELAQKLTLHMRSADLVAFIRAGLLQHHPDLTDAAVRGIVGALGIGVALKTVLTAWGLAFAAEAEAPKPARPRKPAAGAGTG
jgi:hypothetical protein